MHPWRVWDTWPVSTPSHRGPLLALDSASLYYRSYYGMPSSMTAPDGRPHNALRGFLSTITRLVTMHSASSVVAAWDTDWRPQWRVEALPTYKTHRLAVTTEGESLDTEEEPESLGEQVGAIAAILDAVGLPRWGFSDHEADDVLGSLAAQPSRWPTGTDGCLVVSGDRDLVQVINPSVRLLLTVNGGMDKWPALDLQSAEERFGVAPSRYVDMAALRGDPSDGLPGVPGIGAKTAVNLVNAFGDLDSIIDVALAPHAPMTPRIAGRIRENAEAVQAAKRVSTVVCDLPLDHVPLVPSHAADPSGLTAVSEEWGVRRQVRDLQIALGQTELE